MSLRTISQAKEDLWRSGSQATWARVWIGANFTTMTDLSSLDGRDWVHSVRIRESEDSASTAEVRLIREHALLSLATFVDGSKLNASGTLVDIAKAVQIDIAVVPKDTIPASADWEVKFQGYIDKVDWTESPIKLTCRDKTATIDDLTIEDQTEYGASAGGVPTKAVEDLMQDILDDWAATETLYSITGDGGTAFKAGDSPGWNIFEYYQGKQSVGEALRTLAAQIGYNLRYVYNSSTGDYELTLYEPQYSKATADFTLASTDEYYELSKLEISIHDIRNRAVGFFIDRTGVEATSTAGDGFTFADANPDTITRAAGGGESFLTDGFLVGQVIDVSGSSDNDGRYTIAGVTNTVLTLSTDDTLTAGGGSQVGVTVTTGQLTKITKEDLTSQAKYGVRPMEITFGATSQIDTPTEMNSMLDAALTALSEPTATVGVTMPMFPWVELADGCMFSLPADGVHYDSAQLFAPYEIEHAVENGGEAYTAMTMSGKVTGGKRRWLLREGGRHAAPAVDNKRDVAPTVSATGSAPASINITFSDPRIGPPRVEDYAYTRVHLSTTDGFTPTDDNLLKETRETRLEVGGLVPGTTYYVKLVHVDAYGNDSAVSAQQAVATHRVTPYYVDNDREHGVLIPNQDFSAYTRDSGTYPPDFWDVEAGVWGTDIDVSTTVTRTGQRSMRFVTGSTVENPEFASDFFPLTNDSYYDIDLYWQYTGSVGVGLASPILKATIKEYADDKETVETVSFVDAAVLSNYSTGTWYRIKINAFKPQDADTRYGRMFVRCLNWGLTGSSPSTHDLYVDRVRVVRGFAKMATRMGGTQAVSASTWTGFPGDSEDYDYGDNHATGTRATPPTAGVFTCPFDGLYLMSCQTQWTSMANGDRIASRFTVNSAGSPTYVYGPMSITAGTTGQHAQTAQVELSAGDTIELELWTNSSGGGTVAAASVFAVRHLEYAGD